MDEQLTSEACYLNYSPGSVVATREFQDVNAGMYPAYYARKDDHLLVSTSVRSLIEELGDFQENEAFTPPNYSLRQPTTAPRKQALFDRIEQSSLGPPLKRLKQQTKNILRAVRGDDSANKWYECWETIDARIRKVRPFEHVTPDGREQMFSPGGGLSNPDELVERTATCITEYIHRVERAFPDATHIISMGGKDSQLIALAPKLTEEWYAFSSEPNYPVNKAFLEENDLDVKDLYQHDNTNTESVAQFKKKLVCTDLYGHPSHIRWLPALNDIVNQFDGGCILWAGTEGDTFYSHHPDYETDSPVEFFDLHFNRAASWQGIYHQAVANYTGAPLLSPYHSELIWRTVYEEYNPSIIEHGMDLRPRIGERLHGVDVTWPEKNPGPDPWYYDERFQKLNPKEVYRDAIRNSLSPNEPSKV